jgi:hypothetical protein
MGFVVAVTVLDCTPQVRHDNLSDRLILGDLCQQQRSTDSISDRFELKAVNLLDGC